MNDNLNFYHKTVLINETINLLSINNSGVYVDATLGGGGLSQEILNRLGNQGKLISIDVDQDAIDYCKQKFNDDPRIQMFHSNFIDLDKILSSLKINLVNGICMDLGVSSHQIDCPERGFSYMKNAPLDMRMGKTGKSAYDVLNFTEEEKLSEIIWKYGEEKFSKLIAKSICKSRKLKKIETTFDLVNAIEKVVPRYKFGHSAKKTFQAIRIYVNNELENLDIALDKCIKLLNTNGRLLVLSFHSLEDRIVKQKMQFWAKKCVCPEKSPVCTCNKKQEAILLNKKVITASEIEIENNPRSKSAKLRVCQKI